MRNEPTPLHILVIEDDPSVLKAWQMLLELSRRHDVKTAMTGDQAVEIFSRTNQPFDLIICDGQLGPDDEPGWVIIARLQAVADRERRPFPPVLAAPGMLTRTTEERWRAAGVSHFHQKPFDVLAVLKTISNLTGRDFGPA